ncbi:MAG TPA: hypothetical protein VF855_13720 [Acidimicrobiales bacterium]
MEETGWQLGITEDELTIFKSNGLKLGDYREIDSLVAKLANGLGDDEGVQLLQLSTAITDAQRGEARALGEILMLTPEGWLPDDQQRRLVQAAESGNADNYLADDIASGMGIQLRNSLAQRWNDYWGDQFKQYLDANGFRAWWEDQTSVIGGAAGGGYEYQEFQGGQDGTIHYQDFQGGQDSNVQYQELQGDRFRLPVSEDSQAFAYIDTPPGDVRSAAYSSQWWAVFKEWAPNSGLNGGSVDTLDWVRYIGELMANVTTGGAQLLCSELLAGNVAGAHNVAQQHGQFLQEFNDTQNESVDQFRDELDQVINDAYWACVDALAEDYAEFVGQVNQAKQSGQPGT